MKQSKKTIVLGAVAFPSRYSFKAVHALVDKGHEVIPMGIRDGAIADISIINARPKLEGGGHGYDLFKSEQSDRLV